MPNAAVMLITAALSTLGFSILFYVHPRRLLVATLGGLLTTAAYLLAGHFLDGELLPNLIGALVGAGYSEIMARVTKVPVPVYMVPCVIPLVPGVGLYRTMLCLVQNDLGGFVSVGVRTLFISGIIAVTVAVTNAAARNFFVRRPVVPPSAEHNRMPPQDKIP